MIEATSCGGVVIYRGKILALYKSYKNRYEGWVLPKGTVEQGETHIQTALREVREEAGVKASVVKYIGKSHYNFTVPEDIVTKEVHWYLMTADNYHSRPQREDDRFHEICNNRNLRKILLSEVCYDNYQPSSDTNVLPL